jgi:hypothetical protein
MHTQYPDANTNPDPGHYSGHPYTAPTDTDCGATNSYSAYPIGDCNTTNPHPTHANPCGDGGAISSTS